MANESLKAKLEAYEAACAKSYAKTPERVGLKHNKVYTPLDIEVLIMKGTSASRANIRIPAAYSDHVPRPSLDYAYVCRLRYSRRI